MDKKYTKEDNSSSDCACLSAEMETTKKDFNISPDNHSLSFQDVAVKDRCSSSSSFWMKKKQIYFFHSVSEVKKKIVGKAEISNFHQRLLTTFQWFTADLLLLIEELAYGTVGLYQSWMRRVNLLTLFLGTNI